MPKANRASRARRGRDEAGQMMLLAAVLLIFAFLGLSSMVARVAQLGSVTARDQGRPLLLEIDVVHDAVDDTIQALEDTGGMCPSTTTPPAAPVYVCKQKFLDALSGGLAHLVHLESNRGFDLEWAYVDGATSDADADGWPGTTVTACSAATPSPARYVAFRLDDGEIQVSLLSSNAFTYGC